MSESFSDVQRSVTSVAAKVSGLSLLVVGAAQAVINYRATWRSVGDAVSGAFDAVGKQTQAIGDAAKIARGILEATRTDALRTQLETLGQDSDPKQRYDLELKLEERNHAARMEKIGEAADAMRTAMYKAGVQQSEIDSRVSAFRQQAAQAESDRSADRRFQLGKEMLAELDRRSKAEDDKKAQQQARDTKSLLDQQKELA